MKNVDIENAIKRIPKGRIFSYDDILLDNNTPTGAIRSVVERMVNNAQVKRWTDGLSNQFYVPKNSIFGILRPSDNEIIRSFLYKNNVVNGYITGLSLYNKLGLTPQIPRVITIVYNGDTREYEFGTICIKTISSDFIIKKEDVVLLQYLDALRDIVKIVDSNVSDTLAIMYQYIKELAVSAKDRLLKLAQKYYDTRVRMIIEELFSKLDQPVVVSN